MVMLTQYRAVRAPGTSIVAGERRRRERRPGQAEGACRLCVLRSRAPDSSEAESARPLGPIFKVVGATAAAALVLLDVHGSGSPRPMLGPLGAPAAAAAAPMQTVQVAKFTSTKVSGDIVNAASIVKDCRTDAPGFEPLYWITSKSTGQNPLIYAVDEAGQLVATHRVEGRDVGLEEVVFVHSDAGAGRQAEDFLVLADTSNRFNNRDQLRFIEVQPPLPATDEQGRWVKTAGEGEGTGDKDDKIPVERGIDFEFPRLASPDPSSSSSASTSGTYTIPIGPASPSGVDLQYIQEDFDTSAIVAHDDVLWVFSKRKVGSSTALYRLPAKTLSPKPELPAASPKAQKAPGGKPRPVAESIARAAADKAAEEIQNREKPYVLEFIQEFSSGSPVLGADVSSDGRRLAVLTQKTVFLFDITTEASATNLLANFAGRVPLPPSRAPRLGVTWDDAKTMVVLSQDNEITRVTLRA